MKKGFLFCGLAACGLLGFACGSSGDLPPAVTDAGTDAAPGVAVLSATAVSFGAGDCGGAAAKDQKLTVTNQGGQALTWSASLDATDVFSINGASSGSIPAGASADITLSAKAVPASTVAGAVSKATLSLTTSDKTHPQSAIPVSLSAQGATLTLAPDSVDFGQAPVGAQAPDFPLVIRNVGNAPAQITIDKPANADYTIAYTGAPAAVSVAPNATLPGAVARFKASSTATTNALANITVAGAVCGKSASTIALKGQGTAGVVGVSPGTLDFGLVNCGTSGQSFPVTIYNTGNAISAFTAALTLGTASPYTISSEGGAVLAGGQTIITVTPKPIPKTSAITPNLYGDKLTITTDAPGDRPHVIDLKQTAQGAILSWPVTPIDFGRRQVGTTPTSPLAITNTGNLTANVLLVGPAPAFTQPTTTQPVAAGPAVNVNVAFTPSSKPLGAPQSGTLAVTTTDATCAPLPVATIPVTGSSFDIASQVSAGNNHTCARATSGTSYCWGAGFQFGQLGNGTFGQSSTPTAVNTLVAATFVNASIFHSCALVAGAGSCWGNNQFGQLGNGTQTTSNTPVPVTGLANATQISAGFNSSCALIQGGTVQCWGRNQSGQLGNNSAVDSSTPVTVQGIANATMVSVANGGSHACAVTGGTVQCWGFNQNGQLGNGTNVNSPIPVPVSNLTDATAVAAGALFTCALRATGAVVCWGTDANGQLGNGGAADSNVPVPVSNITDATSMHVGAFHGCVIRQDGTAACWGFNRDGALGNATNAQSNVPVAVLQLTTLAQISGGAFHTCALKTGGNLFCWGNGVNGQLGNNSNSSANTPVAVSGF